MINRIDSKFLLWGLFLLQLFLIGAILHFSIISGPVRETAESGIKFISSDGGREYLSPPRESSREIVIKELGNYTRTFAETAFVNHLTRQPLVCFREGTIAESDGSVGVDLNDTEDVRCRCHPGWHGVDCGQPEVIWRAFMAARIPFNFTLSHTGRHRVIYLIQSSVASLQVLEIQLMELLDVVELFVVCDLMEMMTIKSSSVLSSHRQRVLLMRHKDCSPQNMYQHLLMHLPKSVSLRDNDVILFSPLDGIFNRRAITYMKWYENWPQPARFRLKYNVYGFFWQHPDNTVVSGVASRASTFRDYPQESLNRALTVDKAAMIIGDLNHYGGWLCKFCGQPIDIVKRLEYEFEHEHYAFGDSNPKTIDVSYVQSLVTKGFFVDGQLKLNKVQRFGDRYYTPKYVEQNSWNFDNIITNIFAHWEDDSDDEYL
ncbi:uncharacterized protein DMENIID0001_003010 [Sergentomyia squamirostris]